MSLHVLEVQQAIYNYLSSVLAPVPVYDTAPEDAAYPFVDISSQQALPMVAGNGGTPLNAELAEHLVYLTVWSSYRGQAEVLRINASIYSALHNQKISLNIGTAVLCQIQSAESRLDADGLTHQGAVTVRLLVAN